MLSAKERVERQILDFEPPKNENFKDLKQRAEEMREGKK